MKYTLSHVYKTRFDKNRSKDRKLTELFIPMNILGKAVSPFPTYVFINLGIHPDVITSLSFLFIFIGVYFFVVGNALTGSMFWVLFGLLDSIDGDMARCTKPSRYGAIFDSFGADFFYGATPFAVGYFLSNSSVSIGFIPSEFMVLIGAFAGITFIWYRIITEKVLGFSRGEGRGENYSKVSKATVKYGFVKKVLLLYRHTVLRGNFFSEPGLIFWFFVLVFFNAFKVLALYLVVILLYNIGYLLINFIGTYVYFRSVEKRVE